MTSLEPLLLQHETEEIPGLQARKPNKVSTEACCGRLKRMPENESEVLYHSVQNHYMHEIPIFKWCRQLQLHFQGSSN